jgi:putative transposase
VAKKRPFTIDAIVILPDHLHMLWTLPDSDVDYSLRLQQIKRYFSTGLPPMPSNRSQRVKGEKGIWQRRFWEHCVRDDRDWRNHMDYIHFNPVKHGYVHRVNEWTYSSFSRCVEKGLYDLEWGGV